MEMESSLSNEFLSEIDNIEHILIKLNFHRHSFEQKGFASFVTFKKDDIILEFLYGPADWHIEMIISTNKGKFAFKDLLQIPGIAQWVNDHRYKQGTIRKIEAELLWFIDLLNISLPYID